MSILSQHQLVPATVGLELLALTATWRLIWREQAGQSANHALWKLEANTHKYPTSEWHPKLLSHWLIGLVYRCASIGMHVSSKQTLIKQTAEGIYDTISIYIGSTQAPTFPLRHQTDSSAKKGGARKISTSKTPHIYRSPYHIICHFEHICRKWVISQLQLATLTIENQNHKRIYKIYLFML